MARSRLAVEGIESGVDCAYEQVVVGAVLDEGETLALPFSQSFGGTGGDANLHTPRSRDFQRVAGYVLDLGQGQLARV